MGGAQSIPVIGEVATAAEAGGKAIAGGACALFGNDKAAGELLEGAKQSLENYADVNVIASNVRAVVAKVQDDDKEADRLWEKQGKAWTGLAENTPVVGHAIGVYHYIEGDKEGGDRCMIGATRSSAVILASVATRGAGALVAGGFAVAAGIACDGVTTGVNSALKHEFAPTGFLASGERALKTGNANDFFDVVVAPAADFAAGSLGGRLITRAKLAAAERSTPAHVLAEQRGSISSTLGEYKGFNELPGSSKQVLRARIMENPSTSVLVKEFPNPAHAMAQLEAKSSYDFVRLQDGKIRSVKHSDAATISRELGTADRVGHSSLVDPGTKVVAAGEIHVNEQVVIKNMNCGSGHFRIPYKIMKNQVGRQFPRSVLTPHSPLVARLLARSVNKSLRELRAIKMVCIYSPNLLVILVQGDETSEAPLSGSIYVLAVEEKDSPKFLFFPRLESAEDAYSHGSRDNCPRMLYDRTTSAKTENSCKAI